MVSRLHSRLGKIEQQAAPIKAEQERLRAARECREVMLAHLKDHIEHILSLSRYVHGDLPDEEEAIKDVVELNIMYQGEAMKRFGSDEDHRFKATPEQLAELNREMAMRMNLRIFGQHQTAEQYNETEAQWKQARADMEAGAVSAESEAAEYLRQEFKRYPRRRGANRFYNIWEDYEHTKQT